ncbi:PREDICTED: uncharacterized protein LOC103330455 [Prunus mume]|uniref:Uncharacterized protein LOC103330455 n=1 Tax=Prunus mume TaxID=102107 RepID=A0ABM0NXH9_PRUMU|nr:PREDICTED: uncharacterized protein LOC103330455 [Prunus mume]
MIVRLNSLNSHLTSTSLVEPPYLAFGRHYTLHKLLTLNSSSPNSLVFTSFSFACNSNSMSMASTRLVNWDDIAERFAPHAPSSGKGSHVLHNNPQAQSQKKTKKDLGPTTSRHSPSSARLPPQTSIQQGYGMNPISSVSSGTESRAGHVEPQVLENVPVESAPAESSSGTGSTSDNQTFTRKVHRIITKMFRKL